MSSRHQGNRSSLAGFFGSTLEYYDMYIYASASALVFSQIFFPEATGGMGLLLAFGTYGVAYLARPLGGFLAGHFGDTFGRKNVMVVMLLVMGFATVGIGLLPTYEAIGIWAPILLVSLRLLQGMSVGGELAGATSLTMEHAPEGKRAFLVSWLIQGIWAGYIIATLAFIAVATLPDEQLFAWGWRIPFWASILIVILGLWIRLALEEPEEFR
ncbi:MFS transporter [Corynebacterium cystitidis]|nr:MFS transporter [Corynebacterium cystitidis]